MKWRDVEAQEGTYRWEIADRQISWCHENSLPVICGPLLQLDDRGMPDWLAIWQGDFENILAFVSDYIETAVRRYVGKVSMWQCAARVNIGDVLGLADEERLRLAVRAFEIARQLDPQTPAILCFDQPWGEYLGRAERDLSPLHFADILVRSGLEPSGESGLNLERRLFYWPGGSYLRDALECNRVHRGGSLGDARLAIVVVYVTVPSPARSPMSLGLRPRLAAIERAAARTAGTRERTVAMVACKAAPLLLAKPVCAAGLIYNQPKVRFASDMSLPRADLFDAPERCG